MPCTAPQEKVTNGYRYQHACGQCLACRIKKRDEWTARIILESLNHAETVFVTLTYDQENYPADGSLSKRELQLFFKRLRRYTGAKLRYFSCGEYGSRTDRAHYHCVLFGAGLEIKPWIEKSWSRGFVSVKEFKAGRHARYVAKYITKAIGSEKFLQDGRQKEFALMSRKPGIGHCALKPMSEMLKQGRLSLNLSPGIFSNLKMPKQLMPGSLRQNGRLLPMPSYLRKKLIEIAKTEGTFPEDKYYRSLEEFTNSYIKGGSAFGEILRRADARLSALNRGRRYLKRIRSEEEL